MDAVRQTGFLTLRPAVASILAELRLLERVDTAPELEVEAVRDVERGIGLTVPDEVLAIFASFVPRLSESRGFELGRVVAHTGVLRALGARGDLVAVGRERGSERFFCLEKGHTTAETGLLVFEAETREGTRKPLLDFLREELADLRRALPEAPRVDPSLGATFKPRLVRRLPEGSAGIRVRHKTFGEGFVLRELGTGPGRKVQVDFPGKGLKLLQASFLEYLE